MVLVLKLRFGQQRTVPSVGLRRHSQGIVPSGVSRSHRKVGLVHTGKCLVSLCFVGLAKEDFSPLLTLQAISLLQVIELLVDTLLSYVLE